jgi:glucosamine-6-phosphate deaminase
MAAEAHQGAPDVRVLPNREAATELALGELRALLTAGSPPLVSFATGSTFTAMLQWLHGEVVGGRLSLDRLIATHLDEYEGYAADRRGGMVHELCAACPSLLWMLRRGTFLPVPHVGAAEALRQHEARLQQRGGVGIQYVGIGRNGHLAFHEPGVPLDRGFHVAELAAATREDARARFLPAEAPARAITAGVATILAARRIVLCAFGRTKAAAVRSMLEGEVGPACPASALRRHRNVLVLLDQDAAYLLSRPRVARSTDAR